jgi:LacI family transcriptional regulator
MRPSENKKEYYVACMIDRLGPVAAGTRRGVKRFLFEHPAWTLREFHTGDATAEKLLTVTGVDGFIWAAEKQDIAKRNQIVAQIGVPLVDVCLDPNPEPWPQVLPDDIEVGRAAARYFLKRGYRRFAYVSFGAPEVLFAQLRHRGFAEVLRSNGYECAVSPATWYWDLPKEGQISPERQWLQTLERPTALLVAYDKLAHEVLRSAQEAGIRVPEDIAILGVDNDEDTCMLSRPPLSSVELDSQAIGYQACVILEKLMNGLPAPREPLRIAPRRIVTRRSSDLAAIEDAQVADVVNYIARHASSRLNVEDVLRQTHVGQRTLQLRFRKELGRTVVQEICRVRVSRAKDLLVETDQSVEWVARQCGFGSSSVLGNAFRREIGMTPKAYRQAHHPR